MSNHDAIGPGVFLECKEAIQIELCIHLQIFWSTRMARDLVVDNLNRAFIESQY
jgi:hypothetical protein